MPGTLLARMKFQQSSVLRLSALLLLALASWGMEQSIMERNEQDGVFPEFVKESSLDPNAPLPAPAAPGSKGRGKGRAPPPPAPIGGRGAAPKPNWRDAAGYTPLAPAVRPVQAQVAIIETPETPIERKTRKEERRRILKTLRVSTGQSLRNWPKIPSDLEESLLDFLVEDDEILWDVVCDSNTPAGVNNMVLINTDTGARHRITDFADDEIVRIRLVRSTGDVNDLWKPWERYAQNVNHGSLRWLVGNFDFDCNGFGSSTGMFGRFIQIHEIRVRASLLKQQADGAWNSQFAVANGGLCLNNYFDWAADQTNPQLNQRFDAGADRTRKAPQLAQAFGTKLADRGPDDKYWFSTATDNRVGEENDKYYTGNSTATWPLLQAVPEADQLDSSSVAATGESHLQKYGWQHCGRYGPYTMNNMLTAMKACSPEEGSPDRTCFKTGLKGRELEESDFKLCNVVNWMCKNGTPYNPNA